MDMNQDCFAPPPAYSEQEDFDQKISLATDLSRNQSPPVDVDEDGWEVYNPKAFENISTSTSNIHPSIPPYEGTASSSGNQGRPLENQLANYWPKDKPGPIINLPSTTPLRIEKKIRPTQFNVSDSSDAGTYGVNYYQPSPYPPEDPGNFSSSSQAMHFANFGEYQAPASSSTIQPDIHYEQIITELEGETAARSHSPAPPSFEEDDPALSEIDSESIETPIQIPFVAEPHHPVSHPSPNSSALAFQPALDQGPDYSRNSLVDPYYHTTQPVSPRHSLPVRPPLPQVPRARPASSYQPPHVPLMNFNHSIAYGKVPSSVQPKLPVPPKANPQYDPHSFYNSAVSSKLTARGPLQGAPHPNDLWQTQGQFPQQRSQMGTLGQTIPATFPQVVDNVRQTNVWQSDRSVSPYSTVSTYSPSSRPSTNDFNQFPHYSSPPNQNFRYYGNSSITEQGGYNAR